jgi:hypothetical protein
LRFIDNFSCKVRKERKQSESALIGENTPLQIHKSAVHMSVLFPMLIYQPISACFQILLLRFLGDTIHK